MNQPSEAQAINGMQVSRLLSAWLCATLAACAVDATPAEEGTDSAADEADVPAEPEHDSRTAKASRDAAVGASLAAAAPSSPVLEIVCDAALTALHGCPDAGVSSPCAADVCKTSRAPLPDLASLPGVVRSTGASAVAALAKDGGAIDGCQFRYANCVRANPAASEQCTTEARSCGYDPPHEVSPVCAGAFAHCFLADLFDYDRCIAVFKECQGMRN